MKEIVNIDSGKGMRERRQIKMTQKNSLEIKCMHKDIWEMERNNFNHQINPSACELCGGYNARCSSYLANYRYKNILRNKNVFAETNQDEKREKNIY